MGKHNKPGFAPITAGIIGAISVGVIVKNYMQQKPKRESILQKIKNVERKLYNDGWKRAQEIESIKKEVHKKVLQ